MKAPIYSKPAIFELIKKGLPNNVAIVSFVDTKEDKIPFPKGTDVLHVIFYDIRPFTVSKNRYDRILPQAKEIAEYVYQKHSEGKDIICQCDYGVSRSAGLAAAILEMWGNQGIKVFADYRYSPNQFIYNKVLKELRNIEERNK
jgi:protein-tyrosine phosphatase